MIPIKNITNKNLLAAILVLALFTGSCSFEEQTDPNNPIVDEFLRDATIRQLNILVVGVEAGLRNSLPIQTTGSGTMARELYLFNADPRNTGDLLGKNGANLDNNSFYTTAPWSARYRAIKNANILVESVNNTETVTEAERQGYIGFAKTMIAYELLEILKSYGVARIDVSDPDNPGPVLDFDSALAEVRNMLEEGLADINNAGSSFAFGLSAGFEGFDTPDTFAEFNRAVAAIAALYAGDFNAAMVSLNDSYFDLGGNLDVGPKHVYSLSSGDATNDLFKITDQNGDQIIVHNSWMEDAEPGDSRVSSKTSERENPTSQDGLNGTHQTELYETNISPIDIIRNEELILVYAEVNIGLENYSEAETALNIIRNSANLPDYSGALTEEALTEEMLKQRRYSLWCENHRMFDLKRLGLSNTLSVDREGDRIFNQLPVPLTENE
ncbi:RagB/SusD family nutrient uptake outer membrane protein [Sinomicrobium sp. M5D2P17]